MNTERRNLIKLAEYGKSISPGYPAPWNIDAHKFFLRNCMYHLRRDGKMFFKFNEPMTEESKNLYASKGETINDKTYIIKNSGPYLHA